MFKTSAVCSDTSIKALMPLLRCIVDDTLVQAFPLLRNVLLQLLHSPCRLTPGARPIQYSPQDLDPDCWAA